MRISYVMNGRVFSNHIFLICQRELWRNKKHGFFRRRFPAYIFFAVFSYSGDFSTFFLFASVRFSFRFITPNVDLIYARRQMDSLVCKIYGKLLFRYFLGFQSQRMINTSCNLRCGHKRGAVEQKQFFHTYALKVGSGEDCTKTLASVICIRSPPSGRESFVMVLEPINSTKRKENTTPYICSGSYIQLCSKHFSQFNNHAINFLDVGK